MFLCVRQVGNLGLLFMLLFFIYAALGVELFGELGKSAHPPICSKTSVLKKKKKKKHVNNCTQKQAVTYSFLKKLPLIITTPCGSSELCLFSRRLLGHTVVSKLKMSFPI